MLGYFGCIPEVDALELGLGCKQIAKIGMKVRV